MGIKNLKRLLTQLILKRSFKYSEKPLFTLASGEKSPYYIDCKPITLCPEGRLIIGEIAFLMLRALDFKGVGGLTLGADPIAITISDFFLKNSRLIHSLVVRKEPKKHGTNKWIEGNFYDQMPVIIVEDVLTTGGSTIKAINRARECGLEVKHVLVIVDREEGGRQIVKQELNVSVRSMLYKSEISEVFWREQQK